MISKLAQTFSNIDYSEIILMLYKNDRVSLNFDTYLNRLTTQCILNCINHMVKKKKTLILNHSSGLVSFSFAASYSKNGFFFQDQTGLKIESTSA